MSLTVQDPVLSAVAAQQVETGISMVLPLSEIPLAGFIIRVPETATEQVLSATHRENLPLLRAHQAAIQFQPGGVLKADAAIHPVHPVHLGVLHLAGDLPQAHRHGVPILPDHLLHRVRQEDHHPLLILQVAEDSTFINYLF